MTDQITIPRALLEQAREALEYHTQQTRPIQKTEHAILALRTELAKPSAPAQHDAPEVAALKAERDEPNAKVTGATPTGESKSDER